MWAIRRASNTTRNQSYYVLVSRTIYAKPGVHLVNGKDQQSKGDLFLKEKGDPYTGVCCPTRLISCIGSLPAVSLDWARNLSSQVRTNSTDKDDDLEDGFSDLDEPPETDNIGELTDREDKEISEGDSDGENSDVTGDDELGLSQTESDNGEKGLGKKIQSSLFTTIMEAPRFSFANTLDKWVEEGNPLGRPEISLAMLNLRKRRLYGKALQFLEWLEATKRLDFGEREYASHLDLVAKMQGIYKAEKFIDKVPKSFRGEILYRTLLANCVSAVNVKKAEEVFSKIRDNGLPLTIFACNQLLLLYKKVNRKKIGDVLKMMEQEGIKPSLFTYRLLIDTKGRLHDISGMEDVITAMRAEGVEPDLYLQAVIAKHYIFDGHKEKAEAVLKDIEGDDIGNNRAACKVLLPLYASLDKVDDVGRIWNICKDNPRLEECLAAIEAWGKLGNIEKAEEVFEEMIKSWKKLSSKYYNALLKVYANHKLLIKGKDLAKRMSDSGCKIGPSTIDALVKLHVMAGEVEKADSILCKASEQNQLKPFYTTYIYMLETYAKRGDVHHAEKIFHRLKQLGFVGRIRQFQLLLDAYVNAKVPAYGFRERMKADNIFPNKTLSAQLQASDAFRRTEISELLD
ncbi:hypothetical protein HPP92_002182 [Vanilla planifolia]|uniref:PROP1-like PPR domain-containing protein n=1 Tax=Vanilla planifolia TaxID=51239 RepID=A0A835S819_VANPL|nr:hypothetical protein HPP92_002182 [Vanilla planifolia]